MSAVIQNINVSMKIKARQVRTQGTFKISSNLPIISLKFITFSAFCIKGKTYITFLRA